MTIDRRRLLAGSAALGATLLARPALAAQGLDAAQLGVRAGSPDDQSRALQRALDQAARARQPLWLPPGRYRAGDLKLASGAQVFGVRGATILVLTRGPSLIACEGADDVTLSGLSFDGGNQPLPANRGLVQLTDARKFRVIDCEIERAGANGITVERSHGQLTGNTIANAFDNALYAVDNTALVISGNVIAKAGNGGIRVWQNQKRHDGSIVADNTIQDIDARGGGTGQNGNGVNVFRAANVIVRNNMIRRCAFTAVRGNGASNLHVLGNNCADFKETAMYAEFDFEGAVIANNIIDTAENGIAVTNFNDGGRLGIVQGNLVRNLTVRRPGTPIEGAGMGLSVEAETAVTGNVIENAPYAGIRLGYGPYLRNVTLSGNVIRNPGYGVIVSVVRGVGDAAIVGNVITGARLGGVVGMEWAKAVTGDLLKDGASRYPNLTLADNQVR